MTNLPNDLTNTHGIIYNFQKDLYYNEIKKQTMKKIIETINHHHLKLIEKKLNSLLKRAEYLSLLTGVYGETDDDDHNNEYIVICNRIYKLLKNKSHIVDIGYSYHSINPENYKSFIQIVNQSYFHAWCFDDI